MRVKVSGQGFSWLDLAAVVGLIALAFLLADRSGELSGNIAASRRAPPPVTQAELLHEMLSHD